MSSPTPARPTPAGSTPADPTSARPTPPAGVAGDRDNTLAFAPLDDPGDITVQGRVPTSPAWSTSKVLIVAAFLDTVADGDPDRVGAGDRRLITAALTESDGEAVNALRDQIPGRPGPAMNAVLRAIGDTTTVAPDTYQGTMLWSVREQVRFMAAMANGELVSTEASRFLLETMRPIEAHAWGLGTIGATAYKGGWLRSTSPTRQMGVVDGYAVAIITDEGPVALQTDGDDAHVQQMNRLATLLERRLEYEKAQNG